MLGAKPDPRALLSLCLNGGLPRAPLALSTNEPWALRAFAGARGPARIMRAVWGAQGDRRVVISILDGGAAGLIAPARRVSYGLGAASLLALIDGFE